MIVDLRWRLAEIAERQGKNQRTLAQLTGLTEPTVSRCWRNEHKPRAMTIEKFCVALGVEPGALLVLERRSI